MLVPSVPGTSFDYSLVEARSIEWDFPVVEYRPFRLFSREVRAARSFVSEVRGAIEDLREEGLAKERRPARGSPFFVQPMAVGQPAGRMSACATMDW